MTKILYAPEAADDLIGIRDYIRDELKNPTAAENVLTRITQSIRNLETSPEIGTPLSKNIRIDTDYRYLVSGNYITFYRYANSVCYIDRVLYGKRDYLAILFSEQIDLEDETP
ncbi:hypothetical protein AGMMS49983_10060 [Clostridia bacterium]|nr:hypothetical protein AGMMS49983_10060 [Clostridia bacterium]